MDRKRYLEIYKAAEKIFMSCHEGDSYMRERGIDRATAEKFGIGATPAEGYVGKLMKQGFSMDELSTAGLAVSGGSRFYKRLMFPLKDAKGEIVGFSGRDMTGKSPAKYINTPETQYFKKGEVLFNYSEAKKAGKPFIICEGQMDVVAMVKAGFDSAVAPMGTALTDAQKQMIAVYDTVTLCMDGDAPGTAKALKHAIDLYPMKASIVHLPDGHDPDEILRSGGGEALRKLMKGYSIPQMQAILMKEKFAMPDDMSVLTPKSGKDVSRRAPIILDRSIDIAMETIPYIRKYSHDRKADVSFLSKMTGFSPKDINLELSSQKEKLRF